MTIIKEVFWWATSPYTWICVSLVMVGVAGKMLIREKVREHRDATWQPGWWKELPSPNEE